MYVYNYISIKKKIHFMKINENQHQIFNIGRVFIVNEKRATLWCKYYTIIVLYSRGFLNF